MRSILYVGLLFTATSLLAQTPGKDPASTELWSPKPKKITPGNTLGAAPSDAVILFDGKDLSKWTSSKEGPAKWDVKDGAFTVVKGTGGIKTTQTFGDVQLHIEWLEPTTVEGVGQDRGNSGIFLQGKYEIQVLESYTGETYVNGQAGAVYKQHIPLVNATRKPGEWQVYDIVYNAPHFSENGAVISPARMTVFLNGVLIQNNVSVWGPTENVGSPLYVAHGKGSLELQDHGHPVSFRNIWIREL
jgi:Domain of Unknown Function (DUF1080)